MRLHKKLLNLFLTTKLLLTDKCITSFLVGVFSRQISLCRNFHSKVGVGVISDVGVFSVEYGSTFVSKEIGLVHGSGSGTDGCALL